MKIKIKVCVPERSLYLFYAPLKIAELLICHLFPLVLMQICTDMQWIQVGRMNINTLKLQ